VQKLQDYLEIGPGKHAICFDDCPPVCEIMCRDVTSEMGLLPLEEKDIAMQSL